MDNVLTVIVPKGGTGKTTTTINLAGALGRRGLRVLVVDNDWQGSATVHAGVKEPDEVAGLADVLAGRLHAREAIVSRDLFDLLPGNGELVNADVELLASGEAGVYRLRDVLATVAPEYHLVIIDCEPGMAIRSLGALAAADYLLAPVSADYLSLKTLKLFLRVLATAQARYSQMPKHKTAVLCTRYDGRINQSIEVVDVLKKLAPEAGLKFMDVLIPERSAHRRAAASGGVAWEVPGARDLLNPYDYLADLVVKWQ